MSAALVPRGARGSLGGASSGCPGFFGSAQDILPQARGFGVGKESRPICAHLERVYTYTRAFANTYARTQTHTRAHTHTLTHRLAHLYGYHKEELIARCCAHDAEARPLVMSGTSPGTYLEMSAARRGCASRCALAGFTGGGPSAGLV